MSDFKRHGTFSLDILSIYSSSKGEKYDLRGIFNEINLYQDMDNIVTSGYVKVTENGNLISELPIVGREIIEIKFNSYKSSDSPYSDYHRTFFVYAIDGINEYADSRTYNIRFTDVCALMNNDIRLSIKYDEKTEDILKSIKNIFGRESGYKTELQNFEKKTGFKTEIFDFKPEVSTKYDISLTVPNLKPFSLISHLANRSVSEDMNLSESSSFADCVFFQNSKGEYILTSYKKMFENSLKTKNGSDIVLNRRPTNLSDKFIQYNVINFNFNNMFNIQAQKATGLLGYTVFTLDTITSMEQKTEVPYKDVFSIVKDYKTVDEAHEYFSLEYTENPLFVNVVYNTNSNIEDLEREEFIYPTIIKGNPVKQHLRSLSITLELDGASDIDIGKYIKIDLGNTVTNNKTRTIVEYIKDVKWVVSKVRHAITTDDYKTYIECFTPILNRKD